MDKLDTTERVVDFDGIEGRKAFDGAASRTVARVTPVNFIFNALFEKSTIGYDVKWTPQSYNPVLY